MAVYTTNSYAREALTASSFQEVEQGQETVLHSVVPEDAAPLELVSCLPTNGTINVARDGTVSFVVRSDTEVDPASVTVYMDGLPAVIDGSFQAGYTGTILAGGGESVECVFLTHPDFVNKKVDVVVFASSPVPMAF